ncbi:hypothetical protein PGT21_007336 [Puccinia graminis f. sp. tritici]|uniref:Uncharacterized protein n=1 Tax=Puccinia graminis f. sp. tritici TaxID=56615 RepID=A0A5B0N019_PUCGR|nr:hypothetical protein PGT21_007336 [Puccinia graminis f. sp. tritici]
MAKGTERQRLIEYFRNGLRSTGILYKWTSAVGLIIIQNKESEDWARLQPPMIPAVYQRTIALDTSSVKDKSSDNDQCLVHQTSDPAGMFLPFSLHGRTVDPASHLIVAKRSKGSRKTDGPNGDHTRAINGRASITPPVTEANTGAPPTRATHVGNHSTSCTGLACNSRSLLACPVALTGACGSPRFPGSGSMTLENPQDINLHAHQLPFPLSR